MCQCVWVRVGVCHVSKGTSVRVSVMYVNDGERVCAGVCLCVCVCECWCVCVKPTGVCE